MYIVGQEEIDALARVIRSARAVPLRHRQRMRPLRAALRRASRREALRARRERQQRARRGDDRASASGPGDEVLIPAHTYMATATSVLAVGAIPVIVDVDEIDHHRPAGHRGRDRPAHPGRRAGAHVGRRLRHGRDHGDRPRGATSSSSRTPARASAAATRAACSARSAMSALQLQLLQEHDRRRGRRRRRQRRPAGQAGQAAPSTPATSTGTGRDDEKPFASNGARASELMGAMLNVQLDRLPGMIAAMRAEKKRILAGTASLDNLGLKPAPMNSPDDDCADAGDVSPCRRRTRRSASPRSSRASSPARPAGTPTPSGTRC